MAVRPGRLDVRPTAKANPQAPRMDKKSFPAPTRGWIANENLALSQPAGALMLENWFPTSTGIRSRGGSLKYATLAAYTFSRASTATYRTDGGTIATAGVNVIRKQDGALLLEAAATNVALRSQEFDNATWVKSGASVTANSTVAPDGTTTGDTLTDTAASAEHRVTQTFAGVDLTVSQTFYHFAKAGAGGLGIALGIANNANVSPTIGRAFFANNGGVFALSSFSGTTTAASVEALADGWYRLGITGICDPSASSATMRVQINLAPNGSTGYTYLGTGTGSNFIWGAQSEQSASPTSYIPTVASTVTRSADVYSTANPKPVERAWSFKSGNVEEFFCSDANSIYNITTVADADITPTPVVTGQTSGYYSTAQFGTVGGNYLTLVNGTDTPKLYDGSTFANHAFTGLATPQDLSFVWSFANRLFYIRKNTMSVYYLDVDSINGALHEFSLAGIFQEGGSLLCGGKWSMDSGDGLDDKWVVISTAGEVAVYQGTNPGDANNWQKVGIYKITPPMGANCMMQAGGDLLIGTEDGIVPISAAVNKDTAALSLAAVTANIEPEWKAEVTARQSLPWEILKWPTNNMMVVSLPVPNDTTQPYCFAANLETGAWAGRFTGWNTRCLALFGDNGYFGTNDGKVFKMEAGGSDDGSVYTCKYVGLPDHLNAPGLTKTIHQARSIFKSSCPFTAQISASVNYTVDLPGIPSSSADFIQDVWDVGLWDVAIWDAGTASTISTQWVSIGKTGFVFMPQVQITFGVTPKPVTELIAFDVIFENGGLMT